MIRIALAKGKLFDEAIGLYDRAGLPVPEEIRQSRKLHVSDEKHSRAFLAVRAQDVPTYVSQGAADVGIVGRDVLLEQGSDLYQLLDLRIGFCRLVLAAKDASVMAKNGTIRVATKYPNVTRSFFMGKGRACSVIKLYGSVELAPQAMLADAVVDLVSTGETLRANGLVILEEILQSTGLLVVNRVSLKMNKSAIEGMISSLQSVLPPAP
ncbi:MAG: ATP phosphoribosyltransferase [Candidatus Lindowbacteria bacterium RIFCSPLOWO2_12_FULL_62_27]|nr:MAG: ATP phosphoribosyltransferase [Candidatus Lindowbacteria bacterium RIFCSPLOWO2_12_FULL_62_27]